MKKFVTIFPVFLFLSFYVNTIPTVAETKTFTQGMYKFKDIGLSTCSSYNVRNDSPSDRSIVILFDSNQEIR